MFINAVMFHLELKLQKKIPEVNFVGSLNFIPIFVVVAWLNLDVSFFFGL